MLFSVIYSVDVPEGREIADYGPPDPELWDETEWDEQYEYAYLEGEWERGHHRKWAGILDRAQFDKFVTRCKLSAEDVQTLGSIGAPGFGIGWAPAISFQTNESQAIASAYVTPIPEIRRTSLTSEEWERVRRAVLAVYS